MKIVTAGRFFLDIDAYACCVAYAELLNQEGKKALAYSGAPFNESIPAEIRAWKVPFSTEYLASKEDEFEVVDVSDPENFDAIVDIEKVDEIIDHHSGHQKYWKNKIGNHAHIELVGAACTQVFELWEARGKLDTMSETSARLLMAGILDNTLNFKANASTPRDEHAYKELQTIANLPSNWAAHYFDECAQAILGDMKKAIINDSKHVLLKRFSSEPIGFGQLVVWDASEIVQQKLGIVREIMNDYSDTWFINIVSIAEGVSYFLVSEKKVGVWAENTLDVRFVGDFARANRLWLRKEIIEKSNMKVSALVI